MKQIHSEVLGCGLRLVVEPIPNVASVALRWLVPAGSASDPADRQGQSTMLSELIFRGAGGMGSREHSDALDRLGVRRSSRTSTHHLHLEATVLGSRLEEALPLVAMLIREPALSDEAVDPVRSLCLQSLEALDDDPQHVVMLRLRERHLPPPLNRHGYGERADLEAITGDALRGAWRDLFVPSGSILAVAGAVDPGRIAAQLEALLGAWGGQIDEPAVAAAAARGVRHIPQDTNQVHIALAYDAPPEPDEDSMRERLATAVLGGSTSGRLFTEVRQKRSLCYSVGASYDGGRELGLVSLYAGTTPERAQETLDVCVAEIERLDAGATRDEFDRAVIGLKSHLIMQGESTSARASALARDQFRIGRARSLDEIAAAVDAVTLDDLNAYLARRGRRDYTVVTIGPSPLGIRFA